MTVDAAIDEIYQQPLAEFVSARTALAKSFQGAEAARIKALKKPTIVPLAVNQVYWRARGVFDRVLRTGAAVRREQVAALTKGRAADLKSVLEAHRAAISDAVGKAVGFARGIDGQPNPDAISQTFEAASLAQQTP